MPEFRFLVRGNVIDFGCALAAQRGLRRRGERSGPRIGAGFGGGFGVFDCAPFWMRCAAVRMSGIFA